MRPFKSDLVIEEKISESQFRAYFVPLDQNQFRLQPLVDVIRRVIPEFALGYHEGSTIATTEIVDKLKEAAETVYTTEKYQKRGEFGELILHLLLRDFHGTVPLISKIYFKDSMNATVHGFDGVHITVPDKKLWLGESKLYHDGRAGVRELANDLLSHLQADYLRKEFNLLRRKLPVDIPEIDHWRTLMDQHQTLDTILSGICIPLVCTYSSDVFTRNARNPAKLLDEFINECYELKNHFQTVSTTTNIDVILMLLPVPNKDDLNKELNTRLKRMQQI